VITDHLPDGDFRMIESTTTASRPRLMIVDDDEISVGLLATSLSEEFDVLTLTSGESCLEEVLSYRPEIVLLDIQMGGIDGYETCKQLRRMEEDDSMLMRPAVIFVSGHDTLEERLQAYESGGDDFIVKPTAPAEVLHKVKALDNLVAERKHLLAEKDSVQRMATSFFASLSDNGIALQFMRNGLTCTNVADLARMTIAALREYGLGASVQLRPPGACLTFAESGQASPLEESIFAHVSNLDRIFQFRQRLVINYSRISMLVNNLPIEDEERCGRLRNHLVIIAEGCEASLLALIRTTELKVCTQKLHETAAAVRNTFTTLQDQYRKQQSETQAILHHLSERFTKELIYIGLTEQQEDQMQSLLSDSINESLELFQRGLDFDAQLDSLLTNMFIAN